MIVTESALSLIARIESLMGSRNAYDFVVLAGHSDIENISSDRFETERTIFTLASRGYSSTVVARDVDFNEIGRVGIDLASTPFPFLIEFLVPRTSKR